MSAFLLWITWSVALLGVGVALAYRRIDLRTSTIILGFALLFSTPLRIAAAAAGIGAVANLGRLLLLDAGVTAVVAAVAAALAVGLGASILAEWMQAARVTVTVPAVLIMVPGAASYAAIVATIEGDTLAAVQQALEAGFVLVGLAAGLTVARVLAEREWRRTLSP